MENSTPPIGDPKATATPAALAAVIISRILPKDGSSISLDGCIRTYSDFAKTSQTGLLLAIQCNMRRVRTVPLFLRTIRKQLREASTRKNRILSGRCYL